MGRPCEADIDTTTGTTVDATTRRLTRLALTAVILCAAFAGWWLWAPAGPFPTAAHEGSVAETAADASPSPNAPPAAGPGVTIHVSGEVASPGLVEVGGGARVADAIAAAGGALRSADLTALNLAAPVRDGEQVHVPVTGGGGGSSPTTAPLGGGPATVTGDGLVRVNQADAAALETLPGVGPVLAQRVLAHREESGPFQTVEDLLDVPGIGEGRLEAIRDLVAIP